MKGQLKVFTNTNSDKKDDFKTEIEKSDALLFKKSP